MHNPLRLPRKTTSERPKGIRNPPPFLTLLTSKCASHHNGVHFFDISTSKSGPNTTACNFSSLIWPHGSAPAALASLLFDPPEPQIIGKTERFATFRPFHAPASSVFWLFLFSDIFSLLLFSSLTLPSSAFHLSILSEVWLLNFLRLNTIKHPFIPKLLSVPRSGRETRGDFDLFFFRAGKLV